MKQRCFVLLVGLQTVQRNQIRTCRSEWWNNSTISSGNPSLISGVTPQTTALYSHPFFWVMKKWPCRTIAQTRRSCYIYCIWCNCFFNGEMMVMCALWSSVVCVMWCNKELSNSALHANSVHDLLWSTAKTYKGFVSKKCIRSSSDVCCLAIKHSKIHLLAVFRC